MFTALIIFVSYFVLGMVLDALGTVETKATADLNIRRMVIYSGLNGHLAEYSAIVFLFYFAVVEQNLVWLICAGEGTALGRMFGSYLAGRSELKLRQNKRNTRRLKASKTREVNKKAKEEKKKVEKTYPLLDKESNPQKSEISTELSTSK